MTARRLLTRALTGAAALALVLSTLGASPPPPKTAVPDRPEKQEKPEK